MCMLVCFGVMLSVFIFDFSVVRDRFVKDLGVVVCVLGCERFSLVFMVVFILEVCIKCICLCLVIGV